MCQDVKVQIFKSTSKLIVFFLLLQKNAGNSVILKYILDNFHKVKPR